MKRLNVCLIMMLISLSLLRAQNPVSLYTDIKAHQVGDVLSVVLAENAYAVQEFKTNSNSNSETKINAASSGNLANFLPMFGGSGTYDSNYKGNNSAQQKDRLTGRLTVRIVEQTETGMLKIKGEREVGVNGEDNILELEGYIRPRDINSDNTIYSYHIADAKINYRKGGITDSFIAPGAFPKIFSFLVGGLMVAAGAGYFVFNK